MRKIGIIYYDGAIGIPPDRRPGMLKDDDLYEVSDELYAKVVAAFDADEARADDDHETHDCRWADHERELSEMYWARWK